MDWPLAFLPQKQEPRQTGVRGCGDLLLNLEPEDIFNRWSPLLRQSKRVWLPRPLQPVANAPFSNASTGLRTA